MQNKTKTVLKNGWCVLTLILKIDEPLAGQRMVAKCQDLWRHGTKYWTEEVNVANFWSDID